MDKGANTDTQGAPGIRPPKREDLEELAVRFVLNTIDSNMESFEDFFVCVEEAYWHYTDFVLPTDPTLTDLNFQTFAQLLFNNTEALSHYKNHVPALVTRFKQHKQQVAVLGAIMISPDFTEVLLVQDLHSKSWTFPKGKQKRNEMDALAAVREVKEETSYDITPHLREEAHINRQQGERRIKLYIVPNVKKDFPFAPRTRHEIAAVQWFPVSTLMEMLTAPQKHRVGSFRFYLVYPFLTQLKSWIRKQGQQGRGRRGGAANAGSAANKAQQKAIQEQRKEGMGTTLEEQVVYTGASSTSSAAPSGEIPAKQVAPTRQSTTGVLPVLSDIPETSAVQDRLAAAWLDFRFDMKRIVRAVYG